MLLTFATFDFASLFYAYLALENGISQATRFAVTGNQMNDPANPGNLLSRTASIETAMRLATPTLTIADTAFTFSHMSSGRSRVDRRNRRPERHRKSVGQLHLEHPHAAHAAVLHRRPGHAARRVGDEERRTVQLKTGRTDLRSCRGQSIIEMALILPLLCVTVLGVVELSYALLHQHVVTRLTREGSNLISRDTTLQDAATAMANMSQPARELRHQFAADLLRDQARGDGRANNYNKDVLYARYQYGALSATSALTTRGSGSFGAAPDYQAANSDNDTSLQLTNLPANLNATGGMLYVTEIYTAHTLITPLNRFGVSVPTQLYSIAYF